MAPRSSNNHLSRRVASATANSAKQRIAAGSAGTVWLTKTTLTVLRHDHSCTFSRISGGRTSREFHAGPCGSGYTGFTENDKSSPTSICKPGQNPPPVSAQWRQKARCGSLVPPNRQVTGRPHCGQAIIPRSSALRETTGNISGARLVSDFVCIVLRTCKCLNVEPANDVVQQRGRLGRRWTLKSRNAGPGRCNGWFADVQLLTFRAPASSQGRYSCISPAAFLISSNCASLIDLPNWMSLIPRSDSRTGLPYRTDKRTMYTNFRSG